MGTYGREARGKAGGAGERTEREGRGVDAVAGPELTGEAKVRVNFALLLHTPPDDESPTEVMLEDKKLVECAMTDRIPPRNSPL